MTVKYGIFSFFFPFTTKNTSTFYLAKIFKLFSGSHKFQRLYFDIGSNKIHFRIYAFANKKIANRINIIVYVYVADYSSLSASTFLI